MDSRKSGIDLEHTAIFYVAGLLVFAFMLSLMLAHAQLDQETPDNISELDKTSCNLAKWETNATYYWNSASQTCEKVTTITGVNSSG